MKTIVHSRLLQYFDPETCVEIYRIIHDALTNVERATLIIELMTKVVNDKGSKLLPLGSGTNRIGVQIEDIVYKIALDDHGCIDNRREFKYSPNLQPYVAKTYECFDDGLVATFEPYNPFTQDDWNDPNIKNEVLKILDIISDYFFIGDIGYSSVNYGNWGRCRNTGRIGILDFAYIYSVKSKTFLCTCADRPFLRYDNYYVNFVCPSCGKSWTFGELRRRISKQQQEEEIGNISDIAHVIDTEYAEVDSNPNYSMSDDIRNDEDDHTNIKKEQKRLRKIMNRQIITKIEEKPSDRILNWSNGAPKTFDEILNEIRQRNKS